MRIGQLCFALILSFLMAAVTFADTWNDAVKAYNAGDYVKALEVTKPLAEQGHTRAQTYLGMMYANGEGVPQDFQEAFAWYSRAAEQGDVEAQNNLAHGAI